MKKTQFFQGRPRLLKNCGVIITSYPMTNINTFQGNVGIGTNNPNQKTHIHEASGGQVVLAITNTDTGSTNNSGLHIGLDSSENGFIWHKPNTALQFATNNTERMSIAANGRVTTSGQLTVGGILDIPDYIYHSGESDTYFGFPANDTIVMRTAGTDRLTVKSDGKVGIGTTAPITHIDMKSGVFMARSPSNATQTILYYDGGGSGGTNNNQYAIGNAKFGVAQFVNDTGTTGSTITLISKDIGNNPHPGHASIGFAATDTAGTAKFGGQIGFWPQDADCVKQQFRIYTSGESSGYNLPVQQMVVDAIGNVGVGVTDPTYKLDVLDAIRIRGNYPTINFSEGGAAATRPIFRIFNDGAGMDDNNNYLAIQRSSSATAYTSVVHANLAGNVGIGTSDPKSTLEVYKLAAGNDDPGGGILMSRYKNGDTDMRTSAIFSAGYQGYDAIIFKSSSTSSAFSAALPYMRLVTVTVTPTLSIVQAANGGIKYSNIFLQSAGSIGRHYENDAGANYGSSIHFSADTLYPATYTGAINNDVLNLGAIGNRWKNVYTKLVNVDDATGQIDIGNASATHHHAMTIQRAAGSGKLHLLIGNSTADSGGGGYISMGNSNHGVARGAYGLHPTRFGTLVDSNHVMLFTAGVGGAWLVNGNDNYMGINGTNTGYINGNTIATTSDRRIKENIEDINDAGALETLRLLEPKTYTYKHNTQHNSRVYGFIAQEVREVLPNATSVMDNFIPNIQENGVVSDSNVITFTSFNTNDLESNTNGSLAISVYDANLDNLTRSYVNMVEVVDEHSIRVDKNIEGLAYTFNNEGNVISENVTTTITQEEYDDLDDKEGYVADGDVYTNTVRIHSPGDKLFVFGQQVKDFVFLDKASIYTVATAALQEVDRQQQADKLRITELETQLASVLTRLDTVESA